MKAGIIRKNPNVCFEIDTEVELAEAEKACDYGMKYRSVIGFGKASFIEDEDEKKDALAIVMSQYSDREFQFPEEIKGKTAIIKIEISSMTGKQSGFFKT
jgi:nitroimidazol reductase NimA-like FMN-containing flavoprotein (pyridoxamine 5'-phosphate oxidase superfamily)